ncbi:MAG TPA: hypothetical protein VEI07_24155, partial [Planctomycetaceae bacterium]|nr:hypothetical protein [Planctomycetaceae bacterium]
GAMKPKLARELIGLALLLAAVLISQPVQAQPQKTDAPYPSMAPLDQYLIADPNAEIALARSAAPKAISDNAEVLVLERQGYTTAVAGTNGFVCIVERSWTAEIVNPNFWNPKLRGPICYNAPAVRTYLPLTIAKTKLVLAGKTNEQMSKAIEAALDKKELPALEIGAMCFMMSKDGYLDDQAGHWHPHLMFFVPLTDAKSWGADLAGSPVLATEVPEDRLTIFMVPVAKWSDGTPDSHPRN